MRLTCPTCGVEYEIADAMVPATGRHVQCTACHTRWFVRGAVPPAGESEDEIMQRLEARSHLRAVPAPPARTEPPDAGPASDPVPEPVPDAVPDAASAPEAEAPDVPDPAVPQPRPVAAAEPAPAPRPAAVVPSLPPLPRAVPAKPADRPMQARDGVTLRPAPRLDLGAEAEAPAPPREAPRPRRFGWGLLAVLVLVGLSAAAYIWRGELAARVPAAAPALEAYGRTVDNLWLELDRAAGHGD